MMKDKTEVSATKEKRKFVPIFVGENSFLLLHVVILNFISVSKTTKVKTLATKEKKKICINLYRGGFNLAITRYYF